MVMQEDVLLAYQLCFDLFENESQAFNFKVRTLVSLPCTWGGPYMPCRHRIQTCSCQEH